MASGGPGVRNIVGAAAVVLSSVAQGAAILRVDGGAPPGGDGLSWETAFRFLQDALDTAGPGAEIRVAQGIYTPDLDEAGNVTPGDREATFQLRNGVALKGGFGGLGVLDPDDRDVEAYETTFSGDLAGDDGPGFQNNHDNSYHVLTGSATDGTTVLDGCTITAGNANGSPPFPRSRGGGMYADGGSPTVVNCTFRANSSNFDGGAVSVLNGDPTFECCHFLDNRSAYGGALYNCESSSIVTDSTFQDNTATFGGGAIYSEKNSSPAMTGCTFTGNSTSAQYDAPFSGGGAVHNNYLADAVLTACSFAGNTSWIGGAMINRAAGGSRPPNPTISGCTFNGNTAASYGGGIENRGGTTGLITTCTFTGNSATYGGGLDNTGSSPTVANCTFAGNQAWTGAGVRNAHGSSPKISSCLLASNTAQQGGGGMYVEDASGPAVVGCTFTSNSALGSGAFSGGGGLHNNYGATPIVAACMFVGNTAVRGGAVANAIDYPAGPPAPVLVACTFLSNAAGQGGAVSVGIFVSAFVGNSVFDGNQAESGGGGAVRSDGETKLRNCTFTANAAGSSSKGGAIQAGREALVAVANSILWNDWPQEIDDGSLAGVAVSYSNVAGGWPGEGNIDGDPRFFDARGMDDVPGTEDDDLRLRPGSPCIDAGDNSDVPPDVSDLDEDGDTSEPIPTDLDGNPRFVDDPNTADTGNPDGIHSIVDMGAYEFYCPWDLDGSGDVGLLDFEAVINAWGTDPGGLPDFDGDGSVGIGDFLALLIHWGRCR